jgi:uncharacterized protein (TIGR00369 family)
MSASIWKKEFTLKGINNINEHCLPGYLGIEFIAFGEDYLIAKMPVNQHTKQPMGLLHGGASMVLVETLGSVAALLCVADDTQTTVGVEINANHLKSAQQGYVFGKAVPLRIGRNLQVWNIEIRNEADDLICVSRFTVAVISIRA